MKRWLLSAFIFILLSAVSKSQTCILFAVKNDSIFIGADSKATIPVNDTFEYREDCKIWHDNNVYYGCAGKVADRVLDYARKSILKQGIVDDSIEYLSNEARLVLQAEIEVTRQTKPQLYKKLFSNSKTFAHIIFVWFKGNVPMAAGMEFKILTSPTEQVRVGIGYFKFPVIRDHLAHMIKAIGFYDEIFPLYSDQKFWAHHDVANGLEELLRIESDSESESVGPPFSIVRIYKTNAKWYCKGKCQ